MKKFTFPWKIVFLLVSIACSVENLKSGRSEVTTSASFDARQEQDEATQSPIEETETETLEMPKVTDGEQKRGESEASSAPQGPVQSTGLAVVDHSGFSMNCSQCHEKDRPVPSGLWLKHGGEQECSECHTFDSPLSFADQRKPFDHDPVPTTCETCHNGIRPAIPHPQNGECASCHIPKTSWEERKPEALALTHTPKPAACEGCHARPVNLYSRAYPNQGPPVNFDPNDVNFPGSGHLVGKDCLSCHLSPAEGVMSFSFSHSQPNVPFCLPCHYNNGQNRHANENNVSFVGFGNCQTCHTQFDANDNRTFDN